MEDADRNETGFTSEEGTNFTVGGNQTNVILSSPTLLEKLGKRDDW